MTTKKHKSKRKLPESLKFMSACVKSETKVGKKFKAAAKSCGLKWRRRK